MSLCPASPVCRVYGIHRPAVYRVGERALATLESGGTVEIYYSQWGGCDPCLSRVLGGPGDPTKTLSVADWQYRGQSTPAELPRRVDTIDIDAVYHISARGVQVYRPVWPGFSRPGSATATGALVRVDTFGEFRRLRAAVQFLKGVLYGAIAREWLDRATAGDLLALAVRSYCGSDRVHTA